MIEPATLIASADEIDNRLGPIPGRSSDRIAVELRKAASLIEALSAEKADREALDLLQLQQRGRARALRLLDAKRKVSDPATLAQADAYEECGNELNAILSALAAESTVARLTSERDEARKMLSMAQGTMALEGLNIDTHATMVELTKETMAKLITAESERDEARKEVEAERERCANVVRQHLVGWTLTPNGLAREDTAEQILEGILHPTQSDVGGSPVRDERP